MTGSVSVQPILDQIYNAAIDGSRWPKVLGAIAVHFDSPSAHLSFENTQSTQGRMISFGTDPRYAESYAAYYVTRNVLWQAYVEQQCPRVTCDRQIIPKETLRKSEFYNDFLRPQGGDELLVSQFLRDDDGGATLTLWRSSRLGAWQRADVNRLAVLTPHLARAIRIGRDIDTAKVITGLSDEALYRLGRGLFIVSGTGAVLFASRRAEALLAERSGVRLEHGRLFARTAEDSRTLHTLIAAATERGTGGSLTVTRTPGQPLLLCIAPVSAETWRAVGGRPGAMVLSKELGRCGNRPLDAFGRHYRLTPAELKIAREFLLGDGIAAAAARLNISEATARTHCARLFQKTGARRQAELVRILLDFSDGTPMSDDGATADVTG